MTVLPRNEKTNNLGLVPKEYMKEFLRQNSLCPGEHFEIYDVEGEFPLRNKYYVDQRLVLIKVGEPYAYMGRMTIPTEESHSVMWKLLTGRYMVKGGTEMVEVSKVTECKTMLDRIDDIDKSIGYLNTRIKDMNNISGSGNKLLEASTVEIKFDKVVDEQMSSRNSSLCFKLSMGDEVTMGVRDALVKSLLKSTEELETERIILINNLRVSVGDLQ